MATFEYELDMDLPDGIIEDLENQVLRMVQEKFGADYSGDDIEDFNFIFKAKVTVRPKIEGRR